MSCRVREEPLVLGQVTARVEGNGRGALVTFSGQVRDHSRGKVVLGLHYEAYVPMAERVLQALCDAAAARWPGVLVSVDHRVGDLVPGDVAVVIAAAAPHRKEAFLACEHVLEELKAQAPIWKKERYADGEVWVGLGP